VRGTCHRP